MAAMHRASICQMEMNGFSTQPLKYERKGGWFLTKKWAIIFGMGAVLLAAIVGVVVHIWHETNDVKTVVIDKQPPLEIAKEIYHTWDTGERLAPLPFSLDPLEYSVVLSLDNVSETGTIEGFVAIRLECSVPTNNVSVHIAQQGMQIIQQKLAIIQEVTENDTAVLNISWAWEDYEGQMLHLAVAGPGLKAEHTYMVEIYYNLNISSVPLEGFFQLDHSGATMIYAGSSGARQIFPCFDQSEILTPIQFTIIGLNSTTLPVAGNIWQQMDTNGTNEVSWRSKREIDLSYISFALLDETLFHTAPTTDNSDQIITRRIEATQQLLEAIAGVKQRLNEYLGLTETSASAVLLPDVLPSAASSASLALLAENAVLDEEARPPEGLEIERAITPVVIRQSFGFTPRNESYLLECLVTLLQYKIEQMRTGRNYLIGTALQPALSNAEHRFISSIRDPINSPVPVISSDIVTIPKGAAVLHMINQSMPDVFLQALQMSLVDSEEFNPTAFWEELDNSTATFFPENLTLSKMLISWSEQRGFPVINITRNQLDGSVFVSQITYTYLWSNETREELPDWVIPVRMRAQHPIISNNPAIKWLSGEYDNVTIENVTKPHDYGWIVADPKLTGFYLTLYEESNYDRLKGSVAALGPDVRCRLANDVLQLAWAKMLNYSIALDVVKSMLRLRPHYLPWLCALPGLERLAIILRHRPVYNAFQDMIIEMMSPVFNEQVLEMDPRALYDSNPDETAQLKRLSVKLLCKMEDGNCLKWARTHYADWINHNKSVPAHYRESIFCAAVQFGGRNEWELTRDEMKKHPPGARARIDYLNALSCTREESLLQRLLELGTEEQNDTFLSFSESAALWRMMPSRSGSAAQETFEYLRNNWEELKQRFQGSEELLSSAIIGGTDGICTSEDLEQLVQFAKAVEPTLGLEKATLKWQVEKAANRVQWSIDNLHEVEKYLKNKKSFSRNIY